jgi:hypothetical protein
MLRREDPDGPILIGQPAHAWVSGQIARAWGNERFGGFEPWEEVCLAAEQHDVGMAAWDAAPTLNRETGLPGTPGDMPLAEHIGLWAESTSLVVPQSRYAALLVSLHGTGLYEGNEPHPVIEEYLASEHALQDELLASLRADARYAAYASPEVVARNRRLVARFDGISLALCHALDFEHVHEGVPTADGETTLVVTPLARDEYAVEPWPFRNEGVAVVYEGRRVTDTFADEQAMRVGLRHAPWVTLTTRLRRR